jgi:hypothetical protein
VANAEYSRFYFLFFILHFSFFIGRRLRGFLFGGALFRGKSEMTNDKWKMENEIEALVPASLNVTIRRSQSATQSR